jgi:hypothetical protein
MSFLWKFTAVGAAALALSLAPLAWADAWSDARTTAATIDRMIGQAQESAGVAPSPLADDAEFLRRVTLDLTGRVPSEDLARSFLASTDPARRERLVEHLMRSEEYREGWATLWTVWLMGRKPLERGVDRSLFRKWVRDEVIAKDMPQDEFVRQLLTATGRNDQVGPVNYLLQFRNRPEDAAGMVSRQFLGRQIQCAQCHNHPTENFTQRQFWSMAAFFNQTRPRPIRGEDGKPVAAALIDAPRARPLRIPGSDPPVTVTPTYLDGTVVTPGRGVNLRQELARRVTDPANPDFARAAVNRLWAHLTGRGFVEPIDDFRESNPPELTDLLSFLAADFRVHGFDRDHLIRSIVLSQTYQRSSVPTDADAADERLYTHARLRPLTPEELFWSLVAVTGAQPTGQRVPRPDRRTNRELTPEERVDRMVAMFIHNFSDDEMGETTSFDGTIPLSLFMMNSPALNASTSPRFGPTVASALRDTSDLGERVDHLYLAALSRHPTAEERRVAVAHLSRPLAGTTEAQLTQDLLWALINSSEFMFNH